MPPSSPPPSSSTLHRLLLLLCLLSIVGNSVAMKDTLTEAVTLEAGKLPLVRSTYMYGSDSKTSKSLISFDYQIALGADTSPSGLVIFYDTSLPSDWTSCRCGNSSADCVETLKFEPLLYQPFEPKLNGTVEVTKSGELHAMFFVCDDSTNITLKSGEITFKNYYGYLPGSTIAYLHTNGVLLLAYIALTIAFGVFMFKYRTVLLKLQWAIFAVMGVGLIEVACYYFYYVGTNNSGEISKAALFFVLLIHSFKNAVSLLLALVVAMGLLTVKWALGTTHSKLLSLTFAFFIGEFLTEWDKELTLLSKTPSPNPWLTLVIIVFYATATVLFMFWIGLSLIRTMRQLILRRQTLKLEMTKWYAGVLASALVLSIIMIFFESTRWISYTWRAQWVFTQYWEFLFFCVLAAIAFLWRPRANNTRYGYDQYFKPERANPGGPGDDDTHQVPLETLTVLGGGGEITRRGAPAPSTSVPLSEVTVEERVHDIKEGLTDFEKDILEFELPSDDEDDVTLETEIRKMD